MAGVRVTVEDLDTGETMVREIAEGDYVLIPVAPCQLHHIARHATGTVQLTLRGHHPGGEG